MVGFGLFLWMLMLTSIILGFALYIYVFSSKEVPWIKSSGQIIAGIITVIAALMFLYGGIYDPIKGKSVGHQFMKMCGMGMTATCPMMGEPGMMPGGKMMEGKRMMEGKKTMMESKKSTAKGKVTK